MVGNVTIFRNIKETEAPFYRDASVVLNRIKSGASKDIIKRIRLEKDKADAKKLIYRGENFTRLSFQKKLKEDDFKKQIKLDIEKVGM